MPRTWEDFDSYAAEVRVDLGNGRIRSGSGYVIGPCRVLTALHVLIGQEAIERGAKVSIPGGIEVRVHGDFIVRADTVPDRGFTRVRAETGGDYRWQPANLVWPREGADIPRYDVAVLEVPEGKALERVGNAPRVFCLDPPDEDLSCRGTGFAKWAEVRTKKGRDLPNPCTVTGFLTAGAERYRASRVFTVMNGAPENAEEWQGLSGAIFFDTKTRAVVGLASEVRRTSVNNGLWMTRLADLANDLALEDFWTAADLSPPSSADVYAGDNSLGTLIRPIRCSHSPHHDPCAYLHQFDRTTQVDEVFNLLQLLDQAPSQFDPEEPRLPPIFFVSGRIRDLPHEMIKRLRDEVSEALLGDRKPKTRFLEWRPREHAANGVLGLQRDIVNHLTGSKQIVDLSTLAEKAKGQDWTLEIDVCQTDARDINALARFLSLFSGFGASPSPPALYVILFAGETNTLAKEDERIGLFLEDLAQQSAQFADRVILVRDIYLEDCTYTHIRPWVECWEQVCEETAGPYSDHLELTFGNARPFSLRRVKEALSIVPAR
jgi:hypothetical protein